MKPMASKPNDRKTDLERFREIVTVIEKSLFQENPTNVEPKDRFSAVKEVFPNLTDLEIERMSKKLVICLAHSHEQQIPIKESVATMPLHTESTKPQHEAKQAPKNVTINKICLAYKDIEINIPQTGRISTGDTILCLKEIISFMGIVPKETREGEVILIGGDFLDVPNVDEIARDSRMRYVMLLIANIVNSSRFTVKTSGQQMIAISLQDGQSDKPIHISNLPAVLQLGTAKRTTATVFSPTGQLVDMVCCCDVLVEMNDEPYYRVLGNFIEESHFSLELSVNKTVLSYSVDGLMTTKINYNNLLDRETLEMLIVLERLTRKDNYI